MALPSLPSRGSAQAPASAGAHPLPATSEGLKQGGSAPKCIRAGNQPLYRSPPSGFSIPAGGGGPRVTPD